MKRRPTHLIVFVDIFKSFQLVTALLMRLLTDGLGISKRCVATRYHSNYAKAPKGPISVCRLVTLAGDWHSPWEGVLAAVARQGPTSGSVDCLGHREPVIGLGEMAAEPRLVHQNHVHYRVTPKRSPIYHRTVL